MVEVSHHSEAISDCVHVASMRMIAFAMCRAAEASRRKVLGGGGRGGSETCSDGRVYEKKRREVRVYES